MDTNSLFPFKYRIRKTGEAVEVIAWETTDKGARSESDWVSYIDSEGNEHIKEHLTLEWDLVVDNPFGKTLLEPMKMPEFNSWEIRRYEMVKQMVIEKGWPLNNALEVANEIIFMLKAKEEPEKEQ